MFFDTNKVNNALLCKQCERRNIDSKDFTLINGHYNGF